MAFLQTQDGAAVDTDNPLPVSLDGSEIADGTYAGAVEVQGRASGVLTTFKVDPSTGSIQTIGYVHHEIHSESHFYLTGYVELDSAEVFRTKLDAPASAKWSHFVWDISSSGITATTMDEEASGGMTGGTAMIPLNNNRNSEIASGMVVSSGVTAGTAYVTRVDNAKWGVNGFKASVGGGASRDSELVLKSGAAYLRSFVSGSDNNIVQYYAGWYEHTSAA